MSFAYSAFARSLIILLRISGRTQENRHAVISCSRSNLALSAKGAGRPFGGQCHSLPHVRGPLFARTISLRRTIFQEQSAEARLLEVLIRRQRIRHHTTLHHQERDAVRQAPLLVHTLAIKA